MENRNTGKPSRKEWLAYPFVLAAVIGLDRWVKLWVVDHIPLYPAPAEKLPFLPGILCLSHIHNEGAAFSMLEGKRWFFLLLLTVFALMVVFALWKGVLGRPWERWLAVFTLAGALGNGVDRILWGYVVDMFETEFMNFPVFNVADIFITCGCFLYIALLLLLPEKKQS